MFRFMYLSMTGYSPSTFAGTHDMVLATLSGKGRVVFRNSSVLYSQIAVGDFIYIPARTPHRIIPQDDMLMIRYKPLNPGLEAVMWFCERCEAEVWRYEYDADSEIPQAQWLLACELLNADANLRSCKECGTVSNQVDLGEFRWNEIADALAAEHRPA